jgi:cysteine synthase
MMYLLAVETAKKAPEGSVIVTMVPDTAERYLSTPLFASIDADMNEEELKIARSTPSHILEPAA